MSDIDKMRRNLLDLFFPIEMMAHENSQACDAVNVNE